MYNQYKIMLKHCEKLWWRLHFDFKGSVHCTDTGLTLHLTLAAASKTVLVGHTIFPCTLYIYSICQNYALLKVRNKFQ